MVGVLALYGKGNLEGEALLLRTADRLSSARQTRGSGSVQGRLSSSAVLCVRRSAAAGAMDSWNATASSAFSVRYRFARHARKRLEARRVT
jgi:hypothetical protein